MTDTPKKAREPAPPLPRRPRQQIKLGSQPFDREAPTIRAAVADNGRITTLISESSSPSDEGVSEQPIQSHIATQRSRSVSASEALSERYEVLGELGEGGMGTVLLCRDRVIDREVAIKVLPADAAGDSFERFVDEAKTQGRLEHPAIVPVHEIAVSSDGSAYFSMRRVRGNTLAEILDGLAEGEPEMSARYSRRKLLTAFVTICLTIDYAHRSGIVHRDLKPANIMLGDFGEVQLIDWGLARPAGTDEEPRPGQGLEFIDRSGTLVSASVDPASGQPRRVAGTPGYIAPELLTSEALFRPSADLYALGAVLYEILTLQAAHPGDSVQEVFQHTANQRVVRPSLRSPECDVAPELEAICLRALARDPAERHGSARELAEAVELYLDGDRDLTRRRELSRAHALAAETILADTADSSSRTRAISEVSRAVALDPENGDALDLLARLLVTVPDELPLEAEAEFERQVQASRRAAARVGMLAWSARLLFIPLILIMGVLSWPVAGITTMLLVLSLLSAFWLWQRGRVELRHGLVLAGVNALAIAMLSSLFGVFILVPPLVLMHCVQLSTLAERRHRWLIMGSGLLSLLVPLLLELAQVIPPAYSFSGDSIQVLPRMLSFPPGPTLLLLSITTIGLAVVPTLFFGRIHDALRDAERRLFHQAYHLRHLVPAPVRRSLISLSPE